jgi:hypothetical protein
VLLASLHQNYPNPFNPVTRINFELPISAPVVLKVYNILGQEVASLEDDVLSPGYHSVVFDARLLPSGVYVYTIRAGNHRDEQKMVLAK